MNAPLIEVQGLTRTYRTGDEITAALENIDLTIHAGEMVAIMGSSGSGKSTLMNILGCLDRPTAGTYRFAGRDIGALDPDGLAELRREHFGFIFQRYQLLPDFDAVENVYVPAVYAGIDGESRRRRATELLTRLGLGERLHHRPGQLSGGQQQRVSVARALMNGGEVILADEPTGALDSRSGAELMALLRELHAEGHTIIIVTHDPDVAAETQRVIEIKDGRIVADTRQRGPQGQGLFTEDRPPHLPPPCGEGSEIGLGPAKSVIEQGGGARRHHPARKPATQPPLRRTPRWRTGFARFTEALAMAARAMSAHKLRTFLTMLGIIIGIASVVSVVALGQGSQQAVLENISAIGTNTINIYPGSGFGDRSAGRIRTLLPSDAEAIAAQPYADSVTPRVSANATALYRNLSVNASIQGIGPDHFRVSGTDILAGTAFTERSVETSAQQAVIDENARDALFPDGGNPIGAVIMLGKVPVRIIGVVEQPASFGPDGNNATVYLPYTTAMDRILGQSWLSAIAVRVADGTDMALAEAGITSLLTRLHGTTDFYLQNTDTIRQTIESTSQTMTLLISTIAVISLVVGGIGVMNIMLVSVTERTREIGVRMAVGARRGDIMRQFLTESILVCLAGGIAGVGLSFILGAGLTRLMDGANLVYSPLSIVAAVLSASLIGVVFGFMPARSAARLDPVEALARE